MFSTGSLLLWDRETKSTSWPLHGSGAFEGINPQMTISDPSGSLILMSPLQSMIFYGSSIFSNQHPSTPKGRHE